MAVNLFVLSNT